MQEKRSIILPAEGEHPELEITEENMPPGVSRTRTERAYREIRKSFTEIPQVNNRNFRSEIYTRIFVNLAAFARYEQLANEVNDEEKVGNWIANEVVFCRKLFEL